MAAMMRSFQHFFAPLLLIGLITGVLALIPMVGWILGISVFVLSLKYTERDTLSADVIMILAIWLALRALAMQLHIV